MIYPIVQQMNVDEIIVQKVLPEIQGEIGECTVRERLRLFR